MTKCISPTCFFQGPKSRKIEFNFDGGDIGSDGWGKEFDRKLGLIRCAGELLSTFDVRQSGKVKHSFSDMLRQRVFGLVAGNEDFNNHHELRNNPLIQTVAGRDRQLAAPSTLCRFEICGKSISTSTCESGVHSYGTVSGIASDRNEIC